MDVNPTWMIFLVQSKSQCPLVGVSILGLMVLGSPLLRKQNVKPHHRGEVSMLIYVNGEQVEMDVELYNPWPEKEKEDEDDSGLSV